MPLDFVYHQCYRNFVWSNEDRSLTVRLWASKGSLASVSCVFGNKQDFDHCQRAPMRLAYSDGIIDCFEGNLKMEDRRYAYYFVLTGKDNTRWVYTSMGLEPETAKVDSLGSLFQFCYLFDREIPLIPTLATSKGVVYQIFPDRFDIGEPTKPCMAQKSLAIGETPTYRSFFGGDLKGIQNRLDYLKDLGVSVVYLTPIFKSESNHRYDVLDYRTVDPRLGGDKALTDLVDAIHAKGMAIVLDEVFNHASFHHPYFQDAMQKGKESPYWEYFMIHGDKVDVQAKNYETFASVSGMPKWDTSNPKVIKTLTDDIVMVTEKFHIDGWRFDVADEISHYLWESIHDALKAIDPKMILIGEDWLPSENYLDGHQMDGVMNYQFRKIALDLFASSSITAKQAADRLNALLMRYAWPNTLSMFNLLSSHDTPRFHTLCVDDKGNRTLAALAFGVLYPGLFMAYYGDELEMDGGKDPDNRRPIDWASNAFHGSFFNAYRKILGLAKESAKADGSVSICEKDGLLWMVRFDESESLTYVYNPSHKAASTIGIQGDLILSNGYAAHALMPHGFAIWRK